MSEILNAAFAKPRALTQSRYYDMVHRGEIPKYYWDLYPLVQDYYHEFNPFLVHLIYKDAIFPEFKVFTVRDGMFAFADFILRKMKDIPKWKSTFLIPESYVPLVPEKISQQFLSYSLSQTQRPEIKKAKTVMIFGLLNDYYFGSYEDIERRLAPLKDLGPEVKIEACLSQRRVPFLAEEKENLHHIHVPEIVRKIVGNREIKWLRMRDLMEKTVLRDHYLLDLMHNQSFVCDSFLHYWFISRGGMVSSLPQSKKEKNLFDIDVSFGQKLQVRPLPDKERKMTDLIFFSRLNKGEMLNNPIFHQEVKEIVNFSYP
jgi:hypothetical protein